MADNCGGLSFEQLMEYDPLPDELTAYGRGILEKLKVSITCINPALLLVQKRLPFCLVCKKSPLPKRRRRFCSEECGRWWAENHEWTFARAKALIENRKNNSRAVLVRYKDRDGEWAEREIHCPCCVNCDEPETYFGYYKDRKDIHELTYRLEVDHIIPLNGEYRAKSCKNHQDNLRVVCHKCHIELTKEQRALGLFKK